MRIGRYEIVSELGRGASGSVFSCRASDAEALYAVKLLVNPQADALARFDREKRLLARFRESDGFVPLLEAGEEGGIPFFVMPLVPGGTLRERLARGPLAIGKAVELGAALARALGRAHERGIVHRDLKPENVLFSADGKPLVADLGLAKHFVRPEGVARSASISTSGFFLGTPAYMSPEQMSDSKRVGPPADVYALGAILHECLSGCPPFEADSFIELATLVAAGNPRKLRSLRPETPRWLEAVVTRALATDPEARFPEAGALAAALAAGSRPSRRKLAAAFLLLLVVVGAGAALALRRRPAAPPPSPPPSPARPDGRVGELVDRGHAAFLRGDFRAALADFDRALELEPRAPRALQNRGVTRERLGDLDGGMTDVTASIAVDPNDPSAFAIRGRFFLTREALDWALADFERAVRLAPRSADARVDRGTARFRKKDLAGALADGLGAIELDPGSARAWNLAGAAHQHLGDNDRAIAEFTRSIELDERDALAWANRANARKDTGDPRGACADLDRSLELDPRGNPAARRTRGILRFNFGDYAGALEDGNLVVELTPTDSLAWSDRASYRGRSGDLSGAVADATRAIELDPRNAEAYAVRGAAREGDDPEGAIADLGRAIELAPTNAEAWSNRGAIRTRKGPSDEALADLDQAVTLGSVYAWRNRGYVRLARGDAAGAKADLEHYLGLLPPGTPDGAPVRKTLEELRVR